LRILINVPSDFEKLEGTLIQMRTINKFSQINEENTDDTFLSLSVMTFLSRRMLKERLNIPADIVLDYQVR